MALLKDKKEEIIKKYQRSDLDTGSSEVQIALLTSRITYLTEHLNVHKHDVHTRHGLTKLVSKRKRLLGYLKRTKPQAYRELVTQLDVRG